MDYATLHLLVMVIYTCRSVHASLVTGVSSVLVSCAYCELHISVCVLLQCCLNAFPALPLYNSQCCSAHESQSYVEDHYRVVVVQ